MRNSSVDKIIIMNVFSSQALNITNVCIYQRIRQVEDKFICRQHLVFFLFHFFPIKYNNLRIFCVSF